MSSQFSPPLITAQIAITIMSSKLCSFPRLSRESSTALKYLSKLTSIGLFSVIFLSLFSPDFIAFFMQLLGFFSPYPELTLIKCDKLINHENPEPAASAVDVTCGVEYV